MFVYFIYIFQIFLNFVYHFIFYCFIYVYYFIFKCIVFLFITHYFFF